ncbi:hypothetical protein [Flavobacterium sp.]|uniref:hypothetical protein n=1 Tax=Flavobacterium sp. TaxID=239 RepID=UPI00326740AD
MVQIASRKTVLKQLVILFLIMLSSRGLAQELTEPAFVYKDEKNPKLSTINNFINNSVYTAYDDDCFKGSGTVRFQVLKNGTIASFEIEGNLPEVLQSYIKRKIYETEKKWIFSDKKKEISKWFVFLYYLDYSISKDCPKYDEKDDRINDVYGTVYKLFLKTEKMIETPTSYLFTPIYMKAYR